MLDPQGRRDVLAIVQKLHAQGITVVMITQHMAEAAMCQRVIVMGEGRVILDGPPRTVFAQGDALRACRLDLPPVVAMGEMLQKGGMKLPLCLEIEELADAIWQYS